MKILVTGGTSKHTLAILRTLGKKHSIDIVSSLPALVTLGSYSRYCRKTWSLRSDPDDLESYSKELLKILDGQKYDFLLPVGLNSYLAVSKFKEEFQKMTRIVVADWDKMQTAYCRDRAMAFAQEIGVPTPRTYVLDIDKAVDRIDCYPVVVKASDADVSTVYYCSGREELENNLTRLIRGGRTGIVAQEFIKGFGCGFFGVYYQGKLLAHFLHRRIKELPVTGGRSAVAESYFDEKLFDYGRKLGDALKWHGPIMAEFKYVQTESDYKLIEINPKLWGSLDLTIAAGVNVPEMLVNLALGEKVDSYQHYNYVRYRWMFPDEWMVLMSGFSFRNLMRFFKVDSKTKTNFNLTDPLPTILQMARGFFGGCLLFLSRSRRFPHGMIDLLRS